MIRYHYRLDQRLRELTLKGVFAEIDDTVKRRIRCPNGRRQNRTARCSVWRGSRACPTSSSGIGSPRR
ncbi:hypothetical protein GGR40_004254 [Novosphingobium gossypii]